MTGRCAVVTGASGGIGRAISRRLAEIGFRVGVCYRSAAPAAHELLESLPGTGHACWELDVTSRASLDRLADAAGAELGRLDVLVNCAGFSRPVPHEDLEALDDDLIDAIFAVNVRGAFGAARALLPLLQVGTDPMIVNISSIAGTTGQGSNVAYCASKAALDSMTRSLGRALAPTIRVVSVAPGWVEGEYASRMDPNVVAAQRDATPMRRLATANDVAAAVGAVIELRLTTGCIIPVDGGRPLGTV